MGSSLFRPASVWRRDVLWATKWGLAFALVFSGIVLVTHRGRTENLVGSFGLSTILLFYFGAAIVGGIAVGSLLPLTRRGLMAHMLVGFVTMLPLSGMIVVLAREEWQHSRVPLWCFPLIISGILGPLYASAFWYATRRVRGRDGAVWTAVVGANSEPPRDYRTPSRERMGE